MKVNRIYRYYGLTKSNLYEHLKATFTEAFTGFDGVSFETVLATKAASGFEEYNVYLNTNKSMWLRIYWNGITSSSTADTSKHYIEMNFKDGTTYNVVYSDSGSWYRYYNIIRTKYGVMFTNIYPASDAGTMSLSDVDFCNFFMVGEPNVFVHTNSASNTGAAKSADYWWTDSHDAVEQLTQYDELTAGKTVARMQLFNAQSTIQPIVCDHLFRLAYYGGTTGKMKLGNRYVILGCRYALEYDPSDDGTEYIPATTNTEE